MVTALEVRIDGELLRAGEHHHRRTSEHDGAWHRLLAGTVFLPMQITPGAADPRCHPHRQPIAGFELGAVGAHVAHTGLRVVGDA
jgi:hypothetical protein